MKKNLIAMGIALCTMLISVMLIPIGSTAQTVSQNIRYQAVLRDTRGYVRANESLIMTLRLEGSDGTVYEETQSAVTDALGQINVLLGTGIPSSGSNYEEIDWSRPMTLKVYNGSELLSSMPVSSVPSANYAATARTASYSATAAAINGITFNDDADTASSNYYSSAKMARMIQKTAQSSQSGQTALAQEIATRISEDARILDSIAKERRQRTDYDIFLLDSISRVAAQTSSEMSEILEKITDTINLVVNNSKSDMDELRKSLIDTIILLTEELEEELGDLWAALNKEKTDRTSADSLLAVRLTDSVQRIWDSIADIKLDIKDLNFCEAGNPEHGIYTEAIPIYSEEAHTGLFTMPEMKVLRQSANGYLFSHPERHTSLDRSFKTRVMTYNLNEDPLNPTEVYIPVGSDGLEVYVDNNLITEDETYYTYDILVFEVEYYKVSNTRGLMYVTLVRE